MAYCFCGFFFLLALSSTFLLLEFNLTTAQTYIQDFCFDHYRPNTAYHRNLDALLSSISHNITGGSNNHRFYSASVGRFPNTVYGVFQCRGDVTPDACKACARVATTDIKVRCPNKEEITIWYDECWLRFANKIIISTMIGDPKLYFAYSANVSNPSLFRTKLNQLMNELVAQAVSNSTNMFAAGEETTQNIYGLVQCTQDISPRDCARCLKKSINQLPPCCDHKEAGRILKPSCILWFEAYKFFTSTTTTTTSNTGQNKSSNTVILIVVTAVSGAVFLSIIVFLYFRRNNGPKIATDEMPTVESLQFNFESIVAATDNFSYANKLGESGFGPVYKGILSNGREIAVKRLSRDSGKGEEEFKKEVLLLAKLQHRNLVKLLGFCLEGNEKLLIHEYVANSSLGHLLFDALKGTNLDWERRYKIIGGIARGLLYLHEDSPDTIIHRDLKASNILLDMEMNPKISDFGMARLFEVDQTQRITSKVAETFGYMAPEYVMQGQFSVKSDVFSFGVLVLEILTGQKNNSIHEEESGQEDFLSYVWRQWEDGNAFKLLEPTLGECYLRDEVMKCIQIGLLCVQEEVARRPAMASVVLMLNTDSLTVPLPCAPGIFLNTGTEFDVLIEEDGTHTSIHRSQSVVSDVSIIDLHH